MYMRMDSGHSIFNLRSLLGFKEYYTHIYYHMNNITKLIVSTSKKYLYSLFEYKVYFYWYNIYHLNTLTLDNDFFIYII